MNAKFFLKNGYYIFNLDKKIILELKKKLIKKIKKKTSIKIINLNTFHKFYSSNKINNLRLYLYRNINSDKNFLKLIYQSSKKIIEETVGNEIANSNANLSIQYPEDDNSVLDMHTDFFSGESLFQANLWIPFVDVKKTKSMFLINPETSIKILKQIKLSKKETFQKIIKKYKKQMKWLNVKFGQAIIFSPNCLHGNVTNREKTTRWSINIRYKNLYSPYNRIYGNEKKIGTFYKIFSPKLMTKFNLKYNFNEFQK